MGAYSVTRDITRSIHYYVTSYLDRMVNDVDKNLAKKTEKGKNSGKENFEGGGIVLRNSCLR